MTEVKEIIGIDNGYSTLTGNRIQRLKIVLSDGTELDWEEAKRKGLIEATAKTCDIVGTLEVSIKKISPKVKRIIQENKTFYLFSHKTEEKVLWERGKDGKN